MADGSQTSENLRTDLLPSFAPDKQPVADLPGAPPAQVDPVMAEIQKRGLIEPYPQDVDRRTFEQKTRDELLADEIEALDAAHKEYLDRTGGTVYQIFSKGWERLKKLPTSTMNYVHRLHESAVDAGMRLVGGPAIRTAVGTSFAGKFAAATLEEAARRTMLAAPGYAGGALLSGLSRLSYALFEAPAGFIVGAIKGSGETIERQQAEKARERATGASAKEKGVDVGGAVERVVGTLQGALTTGVSSLLQGLIWREPGKFYHWSDVLAHLGIPKDLWISNAIQAKAEMPYDPQAWLISLLDPERAAITRAYHNERARLVREMTPTGMREKIGPLPREVLGAVLAVKLAPQAPIRALAKGTAHAARFVKATGKQGIAFLRRAAEAAKAAGKDVVEFERTGGIYTRFAGGVHRAVTRWSRAGLKERWNSFRAAFERHLGARPPIKNIEIPVDELTEWLDRVERGATLNEAGVWEVPEVDAALTALVKTGPRALMPQYYLPGVGLTPQEYLGGLARLLHHVIEFAPERAKLMRKAWEEAYHLVDQYPEHLRLVLELRTNQWMQDVEPLLDAIVDNYENPARVLDVVRDHIELRKPFETMPDLEKAAERAAQIAGIIEADPQGALARYAADLTDYLTGDLSESLVEMEATLTALKNGSPAEQEQFRKFVEIREFAKEIAGKVRETEADLDTVQKHLEQIKRAEAAMAAGGREVKKVRGEYRLRDQQGVAEQIAKQAEEIVKSAEADPFEIEEPPLSDDLHTRILATTKTDTSPEVLEAGRRAAVEAGAAKLSKLQALAQTAQKAQEYREVKEAYEQLRQGRQNTLVPIPLLQRALGDKVPADQFEALLRQMEADYVIDLQPVSHVDIVPPELRHGVIQDPHRGPLYYVHWRKRGADQALMDLINQGQAVPTSATKPASGRKIEDYKAVKAAYERLQAERQIPLVPIPLLQQELGMPADRLEALLREMEQEYVIDLNAVSHPDAVPPELRHGIIHDPHRGPLYYVHWRKNGAKQTLINLIDQEQIGPEFTVLAKDMPTAVLDTIFDIWREGDDTLAIQHLVSAWPAAKAHLPAYLRANPEALELFKGLHADTLTAMEKVFGEPFLTTKTRAAMWQMWLAAQPEEVQKVAVQTADRLIQGGLDPATAWSATKHHVGKVAGLEEANEFFDRLSEYDVVQEELEAVEKLAKKARKLDKPTRKRVVKQYEGRVKQLREKRTQLAEMLRIDYMRRLHRLYRLGFGSWLADPDGLVRTTELPGPAGELSRAFAKRFGELKVTAEDFGAPLPMEDTILGYFPHIISKEGVTAMRQALRRDVEYLKSKQLGETWLKIEAAMAEGDYQAAKDADFTGLIGELDYDEFLRLTPEAWTEKAQEILARRLETYEALIEKDYDEIILDPELHNKLDLYLTTKIAETSVYGSPVSQIERGREVFRGLPVGAKNDAVNAGRAPEVAGWDWPDNPWNFYEENPVLAIQQYEKALGARVAGQAFQDLVRQFAKDPLLDHVVRPTSMAATPGEVLETGDRWTVMPLDTMKDIQVNEADPLGRMILQIATQPKPGLSFYSLGEEIDRRLTEAAMNLPGYVLPAVARRLTDMTGKALRGLYKFFHGKSREYLYMTPFSAKSHIHNYIDNRLMLASLGVSQENIVRGEAAALMDLAGDWTASKPITSLIDRLAKGELDTTLRPTLEGFRLAVPLDSYLDAPFIREYLSKLPDDEWTAVSGTKERKLWDLDAGKDVPVSAVVGAGHQRRKLMAYLRWKDINKLFEHMAANELQRFGLQSHWRPTPKAAAHGLTEYVKQLKLRRPLTYKALVETAKDILGGEATGELKQFDLATFLENTEVATGELWNRLWAGVDKLVGVDLMSRVAQWVEAGARKAAFFHAIETMQMTPHEALKWVDDAFINYRRPARTFKFTGEKVVKTTSGGEAAEIRPTFKETVELPLFGGYPIGVPESLEGRFGTQGVTEALKRLFPFTTFRIYNFGRTWRRVWENPDFYLRTIHRLTQAGKIGAQVSEKDEDGHAPSYAPEVYWALFNSQLTGAHLQMALPLGMTQRLSRQKYSGRIIRQVMPDFVDVGEAASFLQVLQWPYAALRSLSWAFLEDRAAYTTNYKTLKDLVREEIGHAGFPLLQKTVEYITNTDLKRWKKLDEEEMIDTLLDEAIEARRTSLFGWYITKAQYGLTEALPTVRIQKFFEKFHPAAVRYEPEWRDLARQLGTFYRINLADKSLRFMRTLPKTLTKRASALGKIRAFYREYPEAPWFSGRTLRQELPQDWYRLKLREARDIFRQQIKLPSGRTLWDVIRDVRSRGEELSR